MNQNTQYMAEIKVDGHPRPTRLFAGTREAVETKAQEDLDILRIMYLDMLPSISLTITILCTECAGLGYRYAKSGALRTITCPSCKGKNPREVLSIAQVHTPVTVTNTNQGETP